MQPSGWMITGRCRVEMYVIMNIINTFMQFNCFTTWARLISFRSLVLFGINGIESSLACMPLWRSSRLYIKLAGSYWLWRSRTATVANKFGRLVFILFRWLLFSWFQTSRADCTDNHIEQESFVSNVPWSRPKIYYNIVNSLITYFYKICRQFQTMLVQQVTAPVLYAS